MNEVGVLSGATISYDDVGLGEDVVVLLHGWGCDGSFLAPQAEHLKNNGFRVIVPDLRGHGLSTAPEGTYTMASLADDIAQLCSHLNLSKVFFVGHSMGGNVGLHLASNTTLSRGLVLIDSAVFLAPPVVDMLSGLHGLIRSEGYEEVYRQTIASLMIPSDDPGVCKEILLRTPRAPQHVLAGCLDAHFAQEEFAVCVTKISTPMAYIGASNPLGDPSAFRSAAPHAAIGQTLAAGHFSPLTAPDQINAMLLDFIFAVNRAH